LIEGIGASAICVAFHLYTCGTSRVLITSAMIPAASAQISGQMSSPHPRVSLIAVVFHAIRKWVSAILTTASEFSSVEF